MKLKFGKLFIGYYSGVFFTNLLYTTFFHDLKFILITNSMIFISCIISGLINQREYEKDFIKLSKEEFKIKWD